MQPHGGGRMVVVQRRSDLTGSLVAGKPQGTVMRAFRVAYGICLLQLLYCVQCCAEKCGRTRGYDQNTFDQIQ